MRNILASVLLFFLTTVHASPSNFADFIKPFQEEATLEGNDTLPAEGLLKRQFGCATGYNACAAIGAPGLCCGSNSVCSADAAGHVACCPLNAACTGTIGGGVQATVTASTTTSNSFVFATKTTTGAGGFYVGTATASAQGASTASNARSTPLALQLIRVAKLTSRAAMRHSLEVYTALRSLPQMAALPLRQLRVPWMQQLPARFARA